MPNEFVFWSGKIKFNNLYQIDKFNRYSVMFFPDNAAYNEIMLLKKEGLMNAVKMDDKGGDGYYVNISRPSYITNNNKSVPLAPPEIIDSEGLPFKGQIGHGSDVTLKVEIRRYKKPTGGMGVSARLTSVRVDHLIEVEKNTEFPARAPVEQHLF